MTQPARSLEHGITAGGGSASPLPVSTFDAGAEEHAAYRHALEHLYGRLDTEALDPRNFAAVDRDLDAYRAFLAQLGNPDFSVPIVHVTGTRGKGSFLATLESILRTAGYRTGATISPHLIEVRERIRLNGEDLSRDDFAELYGLLKPFAEKTWNGNRFRTVFELITALAFLAFREKRVDVGLVEVGMGGRLDATNVVRPALSAITRIGLDHTHLLGDTVEKIAWDKGHIIKPGAPCILGRQLPKAKATLEARAREVGSEAWRVGNEIRLEVLDVTEAGTRFNVDTPLRSHRDLLTPLLGEHQAENAAVSVGAADRLAADGIFEVTADQVREGLRHASWPGRGEILGRNPIVMVDGAHTPQGASALSAMLDRIWPGVPRIMLLGFNRDKDADGFLGCFETAPEGVVCTAARTPRAMAPDDVAVIVREHGWSAESADLDNALDTALAKVHAHGIVIATGSLYIVGAIRHLWLRRQGNGRSL